MKTRQRGHSGRADLTYSILTMNGGFYAEILGTVDGLFCRGRCAELGCLAWFDFAGLRALK